MLNISREICIEGRFNPASLECCCSAVTLFKLSDDRKWCKIIASNLFWSFLCYNENNICNKYRNTPSFLSVFDLVVEL